MVRNRTGLAPWSLSREAGIESATVDGTIEVPQYVQPVLDTGFVDEKGNWKGVKSSDKDFIALENSPAIANGAFILAPGVNADGTWPLDMTGFNDIFYAIKSSNGGPIAVEAIMGPDSNSFANLKPVNAAASLKIATDGEPSDEGMYSAFYDGSENIGTAVWNIFQIQGRCRGQKLLQFKFTNNSGGNSDMETAFMRLV